MNEKSFKQLTKVYANEVSRRCILEGVEITEVTSEGTAIKSITFQDKKGNVIKIAYVSYDVSVYAPKEPKYDEKYVLKGQYKGLEVKEIFDLESQAMTRKDELDDCDTLIISKELVEVDNE